MKQLTVRGIDEALHIAIKQAAEEAGLSVNRYVVKLLKRDVGQDKQPKKRKAYHDLDWMIGRWTEEEANAFDEAIKVFDEIDPEDWK